MSKRNKKRLKKVVKKGLGPSKRDLHRGKVSAVVILVMAILAAIAVFLLS